MKNKAFTLIELLIVIAIIGILTAIIIPIISKIGKSKQTTGNSYSVQPNRSIETSPVSSSKTFKIGDKVVIGGISKTGVVNSISQPFGLSGLVVTIITTEGTTIENVNTALLEKIYQ